MQEDLSETDKKIKTGCVVATILVTISLAIYKAISDQSIVSALQALPLLLLAAFYHWLPAIVFYFDRFVRRFW
jgi:hypothetical protein